MPTILFVEHSQRWPYVILIWSKQCIVLLQAGPWGFHMCNYTNHFGPLSFIQKLNVSLGIYDWRIEYNNNYNAIDIYFIGNWLIDWHWYWWMTGPQHSFSHLLYPIHYPEWGLNALHSLTLKLPHLCFVQQRIPSLTGIMFCVSPHDLSGTNGSESLCRDGAKTRWRLQWMY